MKEIRSLDSVCIHVNTEMNSNLNSGISAEAKHNEAKHQAAARGSFSRDLSWRWIPCPALCQGTPLWHG